MKKKTPQEAIWAGEFGTEYQARNQGPVSANVAFFARALARTDGIKSMIEFGAGTGRNLAAISALCPGLDATAIEINAAAAKEIPLSTLWESVDVRVGSILDPVTESNPYDLVLAKGLLIHIAPKHLKKAYHRIVQSAGRYILLAEYYAPTLTMINYRDQKDRLWKGDYAGDLLRAYPKTLRLSDYGFQYHGDPNWPQDDLNWFLLEVTK